MTKFDITTNLANFLQIEIGSVLSTWKGRMSAKKQRELFGKFFGKGTITINGEFETIKHTVGRCFGLDYENTVDCKWCEI